MSPVRLVLVGVGLLAATSCTFTATSAGPTYWGETREVARLQAISERPSERGTDEAMAEWARHPDWEVAQRAVFAAIPDNAGPVEKRFAALSTDQQRALLAYAGGVEGDAASGLVLRLSAAGGMIDEGIAALAGKQDAAAVQGLLDLARTGAGNTPIAAVRALEPPDTGLARDGLIALAATGNPPEVRSAAVDVLSPYDLPEVRAAMFALVAAEDTAISAQVLDHFDKPRGDNEVASGLTATSAVAKGPAAVRFLNRQETLPASVSARFLALVEPAAVVDAAHHGARYEAAVALSNRGDLAGTPALVQLLDDGIYREGSSGVLDGLTLASLPPLREHSPSLTTPSGKGEAARLLARFGGPTDEPAITALATPGDRDALVASLARAPYGLFPDGKVRYTPASTSFEGPVERTLEEVIAEGRTARAIPGDPVLAYVGAARAYLAGARSRQDTAALATAAEAARASFGLAFDNKLGTGKTSLAAPIGAQIAATTKARSGVQPLSGRASTFIPAAQIGGDLACRSEQHVEQEQLYPTSYYYTVLVTNPLKGVMRQRMDSFYGPKTLTDCSMTCYCYVTGESMHEYNLSCDASTPAGSCNCSETTTTSSNPAWDQVVADYESTPDLVEQQLSVPNYRTRVSQVHTEGCDGPLSVAIGTMTHRGELHYSGETRDWIVHNEAQPTHPESGALETVVSESEPGSSDNRASNLEVAVNSALSGFAPTEPHVRAMYAASVKPSVARPDVLAARTALVWSDPALIGTDASSLDHFREVLVSDGATAFPTAWR